jgi:hypothetical protein
MANCGMRVAMDIGVAVTTSPAFSGIFGNAGHDVWERMYVQRHGGTFGPPRACAKKVQEGLNDLLANLPWPGGSRVMRAQRIC